MSRTYFTRYKPKPKTLPPDNIPEPDDPILISKAVAFLAARCRPKHEDARAFKNKVNQQLRYAIKNGHMAEQGGFVLFGDLITWARTKKFEGGLADIRLPVKGSVTADLLPMEGEIRGACLPVTIEECHKALLAADQRIAALERRLDLADRTLQAQRPFVETGRRVRQLKPRN
jgi:hypothetical protein